MHLQPLGKLKVWEWLFFPFLPDFSWKLVCFPSISGFPCFPFPPSWTCSSTSENSWKHLLFLLWDSSLQMTILTRCENSGLFRINAICPSLFCATLGRINWVVAGQKHLLPMSAPILILLVFDALTSTLPIVIKTRSIKENGLTAVTIVAIELRRQESGTRDDSRP